MLRMTLWYRTLNQFLQKRQLSPHSATKYSKQYPISIGQGADDGRVEGTEELTVCVCIWVCVGVGCGVVCVSVFRSVYI